MRQNRRWKRNAPRTDVPDHGRKQRARSGVRCRSWSNCRTRLSHPTREVEWLSHVGQEASVNLKVAHPMLLFVVLLVCSTVP